MLDGFQIYANHHAKAGEKKDGDWVGKKVNQRKKRKIYGNEKTGVIYFSLMSQVKKCVLFHILGKDRYGSKGLEFDPWVCPIKTEVSTPSTRATTNNTFNNWLIGWLLLCYSINLRF